MQGVHFVQWLILVVTDQFLYVEYSSCFFHNCRMQQIPGSHGPDTAAFSQPFFGPVCPPVYVVLPFLTSNKYL